MTKEDFKALDGGFEVCLCNGVVLSEVVEAIKSGATSIEAIGEETDAGTSCELCQSKQIDEDCDRELHLDEILEFVQNS
jgi:NAD(P)H-nitrite reductase large subunit